MCDFTISGVLRRIKIPLASHVSRGQLTFMLPSDDDLIIVSQRRSHSPGQIREKLGCARSKGYFIFRIRIEDDRGSICTVGYTASGALRREIRRAELDITVKEIIPCVVRYRSKGLKYYQVSN